MPDEHVDNEYVCSRCGTVIVVRKWENLPPMIVEQEFHCRARNHGLVEAVTNEIWQLISDFDSGKIQYPSVQ
jgi:hypothetical protein